MKHWKYFVMFLAVLSLLPMTAHAAEPEEAGSCEEPVTFTIEVEPEEWVEEISFTSDIALLQDNVQWSENWTCYGDQLTGVANDIYDKMTTQFQAGTVEYTSSTGGDFSAGFSYDFSYNVEGTSAEDIQTKATQYLEDQVKVVQPELKNAAYAFTYDHPEYFWIRTALTLSAGSDGYTITGSGNTYSATVPLHIKVAFVVNKQYTEQYRKSETDKISAAVKSIIDGCDKFPTIGKLAYFDNWLAENNQYNQAAANNGIDTAGPEPWNVTGALISGNSPVCEGYAKAFQLLCHKIGVPCITVSSSNHMWNMVQVDGQWYYMDCTWNDPVVSGGGVSSFDYSTREYFLICKFDEGGSGGGNGESHAISQSLAFPSAASSDYFNETSGWSRSGDTISGYVSGNEGSECLFALYSSQNQMLGLLPCESIRWGANEVRYIAPEFDASILTSASSGKSFLIDASWRPMQAQVNLK